MRAPIETLDLSPGRCDLLVLQGDDLDVRVQVVAVNDKGEEYGVDLRGGEGYMSVARRPGDQPILEPAYLDIDLSAGVIGFYAHRNLLDFAGSYRYDIEWEFGALHRRTILSGAFHVYDEVSKMP